MTADFTGPIIQWRLPMPLNLFAELGMAVAEVCERHGLDCYYLERDGLGVVHTRPKGGTDGQASEGEPAQAAPDGEGAEDG